MTPAIQSTAPMRLHEMLEDIAPDAKVTGCSFEHAEVLIEQMPQCQFCFARPAETVREFDAHAGYGLALTASARIETGDPDYDSPMILGDGPLLCCSECKAEIVGDVVEPKTRKPRRETPVLRAISLMDTWGAKLDPAFRREMMDLLFQAHDSERGRK